MSVDIKDIPLWFASPKGTARIPSWAEEMHSVRASIEELPRLTVKTPGVVIIQPKNQASMSSLLEQVSGDLVRSADTRVVVGLPGDAKVEIDVMTRVLRHFPKSTRRVGFAYGNELLRQCVLEAAAKLIVELEDRQNQRPDPLAEAKEIIEATRPLLAPSGRLSASAVAETFGLSIAKLGQIIGSSRQALSKTPDSPAIQTALRPFERVARLRARLKTEDFRAWLNRANRLLGGKSPFDLIADGRVEIVAELAEDMLLGTPG